MTQRARTSFEIRPAQIDDVPRLFPLIQAMLAYHRDPLDKFTEDVLKNDGFGPNPAFELLVAEQDDALIGYALYNEAYEVAHAERGYYLNDIYVTNATRKLGVGRALLCALGQQAEKNGKSFVWWIAQDWNEEAFKFYQRLGASPVGVKAFALDTVDIAKLLE